MVAIKFRFAIALAALTVLASIASAGAVRTGRSRELSLPAASGDGVRRVTPDEVRDLLQKGKAVLVDVRAEASYKAGHVKGALLIPLGDIEARARELPKDKMIVTYCS